MLLQTNSYIVPKERRSEHARLMRRFRQVLGRLGCDDFEVYEQTGANWTGPAEGSQRFVQIMRFRDRKHHAALQAAERGDPAAQQLIAEFCEMVNFPYQQQHGFFAVGFYTGVLTPLSARGGATEELPPPMTDELPAMEDGSPEGFAGPVAEAAATPEETQAYAAEALAETHEPGELAAGDEAPAFGEELPLAGEPSFVPEATAEEPTPPPPTPEPAPVAEELPPAPTASRRRKKARG